MGHLLPNEEEFDHVVRNCSFAFVVVGIVTFSTFVWCQAQITIIWWPFYIFGSSLIGLMVGSLVLFGSLRVLDISLSFPWRIHSSSSFFKMLHPVVSRPGRLWNSQYLDLSGCLFKDLLLPFSLLVMVSTFVCPCLLSSLWYGRYDQWKHPLLPPYPRWSVVDVVLSLISFPRVCHPMYASLAVVPSSFRKYFWTLSFISCLIVGVFPRNFFDSVPGRSSCVKALVTRWSLCPRTSNVASLKRLK